MRVCRVMAALIAGLVSAVVAGSSGADGDAPGRRGGTVVMGAIGGIAPLNPVVTRMTVAVNLFDLLYARLLEETAEGDIAPGLAESWEGSADYRTWEFTLRDDAVFHDGVPVDAEDVVFTLGLLAKVRGENWGLPRIVELSAPTEHVVRVEFAERPEPSFLYRLREHMLPQHVAGPEIAAGAALDSLTLGRAPVGAGPFRFVEWRGEANVALAEHDAYHGGRPSLDTVVVRASYGGPDDLWAAVMRGEVDVASHLDPQDIASLGRDAEVRLKWMGSPTYSEVVCNCRESSVLSDRRLRQALSYAIDRRGIWEQLGGDAAAPVEQVLVAGPYQPESRWNDPGVPWPAYDPAECARRLEEAGWLLPAGGLFREKAGRGLELLLVLPGGYTQLEGVAAVLRQNLAEVGVLLRVRTEPAAMFGIPDVLQGTGFDLAWGGFWQALSPEACVRRWHSGDAANRAGYDNRTVDQLIESGRSEYGQERRQAILREIHRALCVDVPAISICRSPSVAVVRQGIEGTEGIAKRGLFRSLPSWYWE